MFKRKKNIFKDAIIEIRSMNSFSFLKQQNVFRLVCDSFPNFHTYYLTKDLLKYKISEWDGLYDKNINVSGYLCVDGKEIEIFFNGDIKEDGTWMRQIEEDLNLIIELKKKYDAEMENRARKAEEEKRNTLNKYREYFK